MRVYVVVSVCAGCVDEVKVSTDPGQAELDLDQKRAELGILEGLEAESENAVELHEIDVDIMPDSVRAVRSVWW